MRKIILPLLAVTGILLTIFMIYRGTQKPQPAPIMFNPAKSPYKYYIAGQGTIESASRNILISVPFAELITNIYVKVGDILKKGDKIFHIDTRTLEANLVKAAQEQKVAELEYARLKTEFSFYERVNVQAAISEQDYAAANYAQKIAFERVLVAQAAVNVIQTNIIRSTIVAPTEGQILQINIRVGEYANVNPFDNTPLMLFGDISVCHLRVQVDEADAWRFIKGAPATAFVRGNTQISIPLTFLYLEPYVIPKKSLIGSDAERVDTRVLEIVYEFANNTYPVFMGQLLDVYIEAQPSGAVT